ncbi:MAG: T9SS type A sorting domain-containing protein [Candidatus Kapaibacterium sp.]
MNRFDSAFSSSQRNPALWLRTVLLAVLFTVGMTSFATAQTINRASPAGNLNQACEGQQITYNTENLGVTGLTYTWTVVGGFITAGAGTPSVTVQWQNVGNQTLTITRNNFGTVTATTTNVAVSRTPTPAIAGSNVVCINSERTYSTLGVAGSNYTWNVGNPTMCAVIGGVPLGVASGSNQVNLRWINTGTTTVSVTETAVGGVCSATTSTNVIVNPIPSPNPQSSTGFGNPTTRRPGIVAANSSHTYTVAATPGNVFQWTIAGGTITSGTASSSSITVQWGIAGVGTLRCRETVPGSDCSTERLDTVLIRPIPAPSITGAGVPAVTQPCANTTATYTTPSVAGNTYTWSVPVNGTILSGQGTNTIVVSWVPAPVWPNVTTTSVSVTETIADALPLGSAGTVTTSTTSIAVKPIPPVTTITGNTVICATNLSNNPQTINNATYTCTVPANTGTGFTGSGTLTPTWTVTGGTITAGQGTATITVQWNNASGAPVTGSVSCLHTSTFGCTSTGTLNVTVNPLTTPAVTGPTAICAQTAGDYITPAVTGNTYVWTVSANGTIVSGQNTNRLRVRWNSAGVGTVTVTQNNPLFGCPTQNTINVTINALPTASLSVSGKTSFCEGGDITICAPIGFDRYVWNTGETARCIVARTTGAYWCMVTNGNTCTASSDTVRLNVTAAPGPTVAISGPTTFCEGGNVVLTAPAGFSAYSWTTTADPNWRATTPSVTVNLAGQYRVLVADAVTGCTGVSAEIDVVVNAAPKPVLSVTGNVNFCAGDSVVVTAPSGFVSYTWVSSSGNSYGTGNRIVIKTTDTVTCQVVDVFGCAGASAAVGVKTPPVVRPVVVSSGPTTFCDGNKVTLTAEDGFTSYMWSNGATTREITVEKSGDYSVTVLDKNSKCPVSSADVSIKVNDNPVKPVVMRVGDVLTAKSSDNIDSWTWTVDGAVIPNATASSYTVTKPGKYAAMATRTGCSTTSDEINILFTGVDEDVVAGASFFSVYPNPTSGRVSLSTGLALNGDVQINVTNAVGVSMMTATGVGTGAGFTTTLDLTTLPAGMYNVVVNNGGERWVVRLVRQ